MSEPLVIVGNGMAAQRLVEELARRALGRYAIAVIGEEPRLAYNRVLLSSVLAREIAAHEIELRPAQWWRDRGVTLLYGQRRDGNRSGHSPLAAGERRDPAFLKLVLATGSRPIRLNVPGMDLPGVMTFRDTVTSCCSKRRRQKKAEAVVIGGGLLGLEAAYGLAKAGAQVDGRASDGSADGAPARCGARR